MREIIKIRASLLFFLLFSITLSGFAEETAVPTANLFISSTPLNAAILIDGEAVLNTTPALARDIESGSHIISIRKEGFAPIDIEITLLPDSTDVIRAELSKNSVIINLPGAESVFLKTDHEKQLPETFRLPEGGFIIKTEDNRYIIEPVYPDETLLKITGTLFTASAILVNAALIRELTEVGEINFPHTNLLTVAEVSTLLLGAASIALINDKNNYMRDYRVYSADLSNLESEAEALFQKAQRALSIGNLEDSLFGFTRLVGEFPDSARFPESLYKIAKLHIISGDTNLAVSELRIIIESFPDAGIYDKACQTLALLYFNSDLLEKSRESAEKMVYFDPLFSSTPAEIEAFGIEEVIENWARNPERQAD
jgi:tetratricopeptide (TPR) repeat protein